MVMPDLLETGISLFNTGKFYEAHEVWEDLWRETNGLLKTCYQGLIQAAVGMYHLSNLNEAGAASQLQKSIRNLETGATAAPELDVEGLVQQLHGILLEMHTGVALTPRIRATRPSS
jgi:predicted metal-dependent hydrolase